MNLDITLGLALEVGLGKVILGLKKLKWSLLSIHL